MSSKKISIDDFEFGKYLSRGRFGKVFVAREKSTKFICALKRISLNDLVNNKTDKAIQYEYYIQKNLQHPNIVHLFGHLYTKDYIYFVLNYEPNGNLYEKLQNHGRLNNIEAATYIYHISRGAEYIHKKNIIHRDLKPENIMIGQNGEAKICDFGWATIRSPNMEIIDLIGTIDYLCPEMILHKPHDNKVDIWCIGVLSYELLVGKVPFKKTNYEATKSKIVQIDYSLPKFVDGQAGELIKQILVKDPNRRPTAFEILQSQWIRTYADKNNNYEKLFNLNMIAVNDELATYDENQNEGLNKNEIGLIDAHKMSQNLKICDDESFYKFDKNDYRKFYKECFERKCFVKINNNINTIIKIKKEL